MAQFLLAMAAKGGEGHILSFNFNARPNGEEVGGSFSKISSQILETSDGKEL